MHYHVRGMKETRNRLPKLFENPPKKLLVFGVSLMLTADWFGLSFAMGLLCAMADLLG